MDQDSPSSLCREALAEIKKEISPLFIGMEKCSVGGLELTEQTPALLGNMAMATSLMDIGDSFGHPACPLVSRSRNSPVEDDDDDDDVVFIESIQPPSISAPAIADQRNFIFASSKNEKPQGNYSVIPPSSRDLASQKGNISETIVIDDEEDIETNGGAEKKSSCFIEWGLPGTKNKTNDLDFSTSSLSRSKIRHEVSVNNVTHKLCSNHCFNKYRLANGLIMNCCEHCGEYMPSKSTGNNILVIGGQQKRFCCQSCINEYKQMMETKSKKLTASENRKRNAFREENEKQLYGSSNTLLKKIEGIPEKKEKTSQLQLSVECGTDTLLIQENVNLPPSSTSTIADTFQEQLEEKNFEDSIVPVVLSADPGTWPRILNIKQRDTLVENVPPQVRNFNFPKDNTGRKFSETYYTRILPNGEKTTRSWLLYSTSKDSVFCLYCKLFGEGKNQLKNENGCKDWQHLSHILSKHEESEMHVNNSVKYSKLKSDLKKNKAIDAAEHRLYENEKNDGVLLLYT
ncbi:zinc finger MYM-type protein 5 isoform X3 [Homo sapiens]|uniref:zinc finger MYM-type protein 5 isoform X3 n=1 Tax=Homo sapiens TaxID=9606 RepID=UPI0023DF1E7F|nr:zinc finger MYM-type protein 5 isoform X3 [Homo sapiens]